MIPIGDDNSQRRLVPVVTWILVILNVAVFLLELMGGDVFIMMWSFIPARFMQDPAGNMITIFTSMFMHAGWFHLIGNMLYLIIFGDNVEDRFGHVKFLLFYVLCGFIAMLAQLIAAPYVTIPNLGASGAIAGVLGAYLVLFPRRRVRVLLGWWIVHLPALIVIGGWILIQVLSSLGSLAGSASAAGGVAYMAHIGGFLSGLVLSFFFRNRVRALPPSYM
ncbi:MAG TPA: rhomboid family intramembrane serine protease [Anaerolineaceae bacterium]|nr:rhomboid family intramembrane serine protease [Anaerolineaceae bacterium]HOQ69593.1 rhomboid family intramembrane serine protease [Anaerolineaceae bacterium]HOS53737.1 rhomboid family intramembrane serine protease [Anaerolineaceae bacterium]HQF68270.1 rhomboid family intramembrane serine protease [Anaerolineaceae bacterium]HQK04812.1 rhomboid family intramembrane serine protease [Anaerolineaceae bacterium]